jgi:hypothetical protein
MKSSVAYVVFKQGYDYLTKHNFHAYSLCDQKDMNYQGSTCICRVPKAQVRTGTVVECVHCGTVVRDLS